MTDAGERAPAEEAREFARAYQGFLRWIHEDPGDGPRNPLVALVRDHLADRVDESVLGNELPPFEHINVQVALDAWMAAEGRTVHVHGIALPPHYESPTLQQIVHGESLGPVRIAAPDLVDLPSGPRRTTACLRRAVLLVEDSRGRYVVAVRGPQPHMEPMVAVEVAGLPKDRAREVLGELAELRHRLNVYRGQVLEFVPGPTGVAVSFPSLTPTERADVVLPEDTLRRVERHTFDVAAHSEALLQAGQHLKRGLLLFGPPGTGKTHTMRYVVQHLHGATVLMLSGQSLHMIGYIAQMARDLQPALVVLEDVDLVAEDRGFGPGPSPVLFSLLDAMDGAAADADLLFLLTTNRPDLLEPALAARPGRVDVAVEIPMPNADARRRLFAVYTRDVAMALSDTDIDEVVTRTEGVTASFIKELVRRSVLESLTAGHAPGEPLTADVVGRALDDLLDSGQRVTRALLGMEGAEPAGGRTAGGHASIGWIGHPMPGRYGVQPAAYGSDFTITPDVDN